MASGLGSPFASMESFNEEYLSRLKYANLKRLAIKHNIKMRWAKKEELVKSLLALKSDEVMDNEKNEEAEWVDGSMIDGIMPLPNVESVRGTFTLEKNNHSRGTYDLTTVINDVLPSLGQSGNRRLTFDIPMKKPAPPKKKEPSSVKMLTVPYSPCTSRTSNARPSISARPLNKVSNKSIAIKKSRVASSPMKVANALSSSLAYTTVSPRFKGRIAQTTARAINTQAKDIRALNKTTNNYARRSETIVPRNKTSVVTERASSSEEKENVTNLNPSVTKGPSRPIIQNSTTKTVNHTFTRRKSKSDDPAARRASGTTLIASFRTPQAKNPSSSKPKVKGSGGFTATKLPDFASIHKRQFEKMDSLDEYVNKKADRVKKLFGTPLAQRTDKIIQQKSRILPGTKEANQIKKPPLSQVAACKLISKIPTLRTRTDVKDKNRSHIHGIRTNKRFELQMKFRNI